MSSQSPPHDRSPDASTPISTPDGVTIRAVDPSDTDGLRAWNAAAREAYCAGRDTVWWEALDALRVHFAEIPPGRLVRALVAEDPDGGVVGTVDMEARPGEPADVEIGVLPSRRRRGIGTALASAAEAELATWASSSGPNAGDAADSAPVPPVQVEVYTDEGVAFAQRLGLAEGNREHRLLRDLPIATDELDALDRPNSCVQTFSWSGPVPDDLAVDWARLQTQMQEDVPMGDLTRTVRASDIRAVRDHEKRMTDRGWILVRSLAQLDGASVGYTVILLSRENPEIAVQDDTLVDRAHRGHGVGRALKTANLRQLMTMPEASDTRHVQTFTATSNAPMLALNKAFGFRVADTMTALEGQFRAN
jgi:mycothiol synthase